MATKNARLLPKRTAISGRIPTGTTGDESSFIKQGELAVNTADKKIFSYDGSNVFEFGANSFLGLSGGTINGNLTVTGNTSLQTLSATTFFSGSTPLETIINNLIPDEELIYQIYSSTALTEINQTVIISSTTATTITLPQITRNNVKISVKSISTGENTILPFGVQTIDGGSSFITERQNTCIDLKSFGSNWIIY